MREADVLDRDGLLVVAAEQPANGAREARLLLVGAKGFGQAADFDGRPSHGSRFTEKVAAASNRGWRGLRLRGRSVPKGAARDSAQRMSCFSR